MFIAINDMTGEVFSFATQDDATKICLHENRKHPDHPCFSLFAAWGNNQKASFVGKLWRRFGCDFDEKNCWNPHSGGGLEEL